MLTAQCHRHRGEPDQGRLVRSRSSRMALEASWAGSVELASLIGASNRRPIAGELIDAWPENVGFLRLAAIAVIKPVSFLCT